MSPGDTLTSSLLLSICKTRKSYYFPKNSQSVRACVRALLPVELMNAKQVFYYLATSSDPEDSILVAILGKILSK